MPTAQVAGADLVPADEPRSSSLGRYGRQNVAVLLLQGVAAALLLTVVDTTAWPLPPRALAVLAFCPLMQGVFTMMHEYAHGNGHADPRLNYAIGFVSCFLFGTSATFLRVQHWGHHRRNRTAAERGEFIHEDESALAKTLQYYFVILGGLWAMCVLFPLLSIVTPYRVARRLARSGRYNTYAAAYAEFTPRDWQVMRVEALLLVAAWSALLLHGPWRAGTIAIAYAAFAFSWSSLQWIYHMHTPIHVVEGAYNLRLPAPLRVLFLNFNYNLTHHRQPALPWQELYRKSDQGETQPLWYRWLLGFRPPVRFPSDLGVLEKRYF